MDRILGRLHSLGYIQVVLFGTLLALAAPHTYANQAQELKEIRQIYYSAQKVIEKKSTKVILFRSVAGKTPGYQINGWRLEGKGKSDFKKGPYEAMVLIAHSKIVKTRITIDSLSGDWGYVTEYYYYPNGNVAFIYEGLSTYNGFDLVNGKPESLGKLYVIEKRSYYSKDGKRLKYLRKAFVERTGKAVALGQVYDIQPKERYMSICALPFSSQLGPYIPKPCSTTGKKVAPAGKDRATSG